MRNSVLTRPELPPTTAYLPATSSSSNSPWCAQRAERRKPVNERALLSRTDNVESATLRNGGVQRDESNSGRCRTAPERVSIQQHTGQLFDSNTEKMTVFQQTLTPSDSRTDSMCVDLQGRRANAANVNKIATKATSPCESVVGSTTANHPDFANESHLLSAQKDEELQALQFELSEKIAEEATLTKLIHANQQKMKAVSADVFVLKETIVSVERVSSSRQRSVDRMSSVNMTLIDTLDALELQPSTDKGKHLLPSPLLSFPVIR